MRARKRRKSKSGIRLRVPLSARRTARKLFGEHFIIFPKEYRLINPEGDSAGKTVYGYVDWAVGIRLSDDAWRTGTWAARTRVACYGRGKTPMSAVRSAMWNMVLGEHPDIVYERILEDR
jgi:hypothetical protein